MHDTILSALYDELQKSGLLVTRNDPFVCMLQAAQPSPLSYWKYNFTITYIRIQDSCVILE